MIYKLIVIVLILDQCLQLSIIPELIKAAPEAANKIKQLIDGNGNKVDEPKVLSDDKLIDQSIEFLRGKGYDISM